MSNEVIKPSDNSLALVVKYTGNRMYIKFSGSFLKQDKISFNHRKTPNIYIVCNLKSNLIKLSKNSDTDKYEYASYGTGFDSKGTFSHPSGTTGANVVIFGADMNSSVIL